MSGCGPNQENSHGEAGCCPTVQENDIEYDCQHSHKQQEHLFEALEVLVVDFADGRVKDENKLGAAEGNEGSH